MIVSVLGARVADFLVLGLLFAGAALAAGRALGRHWRPAWQAPAYALLLGLGHRFLLYALFSGELLSAAHVLGRLARIGPGTTAMKVSATMNEVARSAK